MGVVELCKEYALQHGSGHGDKKLRASASTLLPSHRAIPGTGGADVQQAGKWSRGKAGLQTQGIEREYLARLSGVCDLLVA